MVSASTTGDTTPLALRTKATTNIQTIPSVTARLDRSMRSCMCWYRMRLTGLGVLLVRTWSTLGSGPLLSHSYCAHSYYAQHLCHQLAVQDAAKEEEQQRWQVQATCRRSSQQPGQEEAARPGDYRQAPNDSTQAPC